MLAAHGLLLLLPLAQVSDLETDDGLFVAHTERARGFENAREEHAIWKVDVFERTAGDSELLLWTQPLTTEQLGDRRLLAPDGSALVTIRSELFGTRPLVRIYRHGSDPDGLREDDLGLARRDFRKVGGRRRWLIDRLSASWIGWREDVAGLQLVLELECVDGRVFVIDLETGELLGEPPERFVTIEPGVDLPGTAHKTSARVTGYLATQVVSEGEPLRVSVNARRSAPCERFAGFELEFRGDEQIALIPRLVRTSSFVTVVQHDVHFDATAVITGLQPGVWQLVVEGANGVFGEPTTVDVLTPGLVTTLRTLHASGQVAETISLFDRPVARLTTARGEVSYLNVPGEAFERALRILDRLPRNGYERTSRRDRGQVTYELAWWPYGERRTVVVNSRSARGRIEELIELLRALG
jgi:hypothetical protein